MFSTKAEKYARYRWSYAPQAVETLFELAGLTKKSVVADIGAGTGILTKEFIGKVGLICAVEPNPAMRAFAQQAFAPDPTCRVAAGRAEATTLPEDSIDLLTAAQAVHWFEPESAKREFSRILKPGGWLAILRNYGPDQALSQALQGVFPAECVTEALMVGRNTPQSFYFQVDKYEKLDFPFHNDITWEEFMGSHASASSAPDEGSPAYAHLEQEARRIFERFSTDGRIAIHGVTELYIGQIVKS